MGIHFESANEGDLPRVSKAVGGDPIKRTYPLNLRGLTAEILSQIVEVLGLLTHYIVGGYQTDDRPISGKAQAQERSY